MREANTASPLARNVSAFAFFLSAFVSVLAVPLITEVTRQRVYHYFIEHFSHDWALTASWTAVGLLGLCVLFGLSALLQMAVQLLFYRAIQRGGY